ncbi:MAG: hypothetical protein IH627_16485 [Rubrivivax sp.]|nr:hypothetical protein [Rubrivivax sp.]
MLGEQGVDALVLRRVVVEPQAQQDVGIDADHRPADLQPRAAGACFFLRCSAPASSIAAVCGELPSVLGVNMV